MAKFHQYIKDGKYKVGEHGLSCEPSFSKFKKELMNADEDNDYIFPFDVPEGSVVSIKKLDLESALDEDAFEIKIISLGDTEVPFDQQAAEKGRVYYSTDHGVFGSGNVAFMKEGVGEGYEDDQEADEPEWDGETKDIEPQTENLDMSFAANSEGETYLDTKTVEGALSNEYNEGAGSKTKVIYGTIAGGRAGNDYHAKIIELDLTSFVTFEKNYLELSEEGEIIDPNDGGDYRDIYNTLIKRQTLAVHDSFGEGVISFGFKKAEVKTAALSELNGGEDSSEDFDDLDENLDTNKKLTMKNNLSESSYDDFQRNYGSQISIAVNQLKRIHDIDENEIIKYHDKIDRALNNYDENLNDFIFGIQPPTFTDIVNLAIRNQDRYGTEPRQVLNAIGDVYNVLQRVGLIVKPEEEMDEIKKVHSYKGQHGVGYGTDDMSSEAEEPSAGTYKGVEFGPDVKAADFGEPVTSIANLKVGQDYIIWEPGMNNWLGHWTFQGERAPNEWTFTSSHQFEEDNENIFTADELHEYIKDEAIITMNTSKHEGESLDEATIEGTEEYKGLRYQVLHKIPYGYYVKGLGEEAKEVLGGPVYFDKYELAKEHADLSIEGYLEEPESEEPDNEPWIDPAGGHHSGNEDDPAEMYKETDLDSQIKTAYLDAREDILNHKQAVEKVAKQFNIADTDVEADLKRLGINNDEMENENYYEVHSEDKKTIKSLVEDKGYKLIDVKGSLKESKTPHIYSIIVEKHKQQTTIMYDDTKGYIQRPFTIGSNSFRYLQEALDNIVVTAKSFLKEAEEIDETIHTETLAEIKNKEVLAEQFGKLTDNLPATEAERRKQRSLDLIESIVPKKKK